jgi:hypothetical protein
MHESAAQGNVHLQEVILIAAVVSCGETRKWIVRE